MFKPIPRVLWAFPVISIILAGLLFPGGISWASEVPLPTVSAEPKVTPTRMPPVSSFDRNLYSLDASGSLWVIVNKRTPLYPLKYKPRGITQVALPSAGNPYNQSLAKPAAEALVKLAKAMKAAGAGTLVLQSGYRSYASQVSVHKRQVARFGLAKGEALAARPGYSEHQTGLAGDLGALGQGCVIRICFAKTKGGSWLAKNAYKYGFILRYPDGQTKVTGYQFEPWHFRFVGPELANEMRLEHIGVLELFWHLPAAPAYEN